MGCERLVDWRRFIQVGVVPFGATPRHSDASRGVQLIT